MFGSTVDGDAAVCAGLPTSDDMARDEEKTRRAPRAEGRGWVPAAAC